LGEAFFNGWEGQASDQAAAATWFVRAAEHGHRGAQRNLGEMYFQGFGVAQDQAKAFKLLKRAAEPPLSDAQFNVAFMLHTGQG
ncbi:unnamed protein product, partial [Polarella glacialis]